MRLFASYALVVGRGGRGAGGDSRAARRPRRSTSASGLPESTARPRPSRTTRSSTRCWARCRSRSWSSVGAAGHRRGVRRATDPAPDQRRPPRPRGVSPQATTTNGCHHPRELELAALAADVNRLADALETTERRRAQLISEVAHEMRTPLTTIQRLRRRHPRRRVRARRGGPHRGRSKRRRGSSASPRTSRRSRVPRRHALPLQITREDLGELATCRSDTAATPVRRQGRHARHRRTAAASRRRRPRPDLAGDHEPPRQRARLHAGKRTRRRDSRASRRPRGRRRLRHRSRHRRRGSRAGLRTLLPGAGIDPPERRERDRAHDRRGIAQAHSGDVKVASEGLGEGATFTLELPLACTSTGYPLWPSVRPRTSRTRKPKRGIARDALPTLGRTEQHAPQPSRQAPNRRSGVVATGRWARWRPRRSAVRRAAVLGGATGTVQSRNRSRAALCAQRRGHRSR